MFTSLVLAWPFPPCTRNPSTDHPQGCGLSRSRPINQSISSTYARWATLSRSSSMYMTIAFHPADPEPDVIAFA
jgi:hypothetical protein